MDDIEKLPLDEPASWFAPLFDKLSSWGETAVAMLPNALVALVVLLVFWPVARWSGRAIERLTQRLSGSREVSGLAGVLGRTAVMGGGLFLALNVLHLSQAVTSLLAGLGVAGLALGFALQDVAANFMSGLMLAVRRPFEVGHDIETNGFRGLVRRIDLRATTLETFTGEVVTLPNKQVYENPITNYEATKRRRVDVEVGVAYGTDLERVEQLTCEVLAPLSTHERGVQVFFTGFGGSSIDLVARVWIDLNDQATWLDTRSRMVMDIHKAYNDAGIEIPFPIRTLMPGAGLERATEHWLEEAAAAK